MSYVLINGKRYYKDDRTGRTMLDNVSQAEADRRAQRNPSTPRPPRTTGTYRPQTTTLRNVASTSHTSHTGIPRKAVIACVVVVLFIAAFFHNRSHVSAEEEAINYYMNGQQAAPAETVGDDQSASPEDEWAEGEEAAASADYLMPDSADRYLEPSDIQGYSSYEIQLIINEIYARHGREFHSQEYVDYFSSKDWYNPVPGKSDETIVSEFNEFEKANVRLLSKYV